MPTLAHGRALVGLVPLIFLSGCGVSYSGGADGWTSITVPGVAPSLQFDLGPKVVFAGSCVAEPPSPTFGIIDGDYGPAVRRFTVRVDGQTHTFDAFAGNKDASRALMMIPNGASGSAEEAGDQRAIEAMLAGAKSPIVITADDGWTRSVPPSPKIGEFIASCHRRLRSHSAKG